ncbi:MAG: FxsA family protein [Frankiales bacterium]|nr:FxsA family protein [Frankiales bacterium]
MPLVLLVVFIVVPLAELWVLIQVGQAIGVLPTILLLLLDALLGTWLFRSQGRKTWQAFRQALVERRLPTVEVADGALVVLGGALLLTPGFLTDVLGVLCLLPPTRAVLRRSLTGVVGRRLLGGAGVMRSADEPWRQP